MKKSCLGLPMSNRLWPSFTKIRANVPLFYLLMSFLTHVRNESLSDLYSFVSFIEIQTTVLNLIKSEFIGSVVIYTLVR